MPRTVSPRGVAIGLASLLALAPLGCDQGTPSTPGNASGTNTATNPGTPPSTPSTPAPATNPPAQPATPTTQPESAAITVDAGLPAYRATEGISGSLKSVGSDTMNNLMSAWFESFESFYPAVTTAVEGAGSSTAPPALIQGQSQFGPMSRAMKQTEIDQFRDAFGYEPTALESAIDCLAVYVHRDCPLEQLTLEQVAAIFGAGEPMTWADLGVEDPAWADKPIAVYGRNEASGTYGFFKEIALGGRDFRDTVRVQPGSSAVVQAVATDPYSMGYSGIGYRTADVKPLALSNSDAGYFPPSYQAALDGSYPLARYLYVYINYDARAGLDPLRAEFVKLMLSRQGQEAVVKDGYYPVTAQMAADDLARLNLQP